MRGEFEGTVRLQWDPDHLPNLECHAARRAVQLGLKGVRGFASGADIVAIEDVTPFVRAQAAVAARAAKLRIGPEGDVEESAAAAELLVARERVFVPRSETARRMLALDHWPGEDLYNLL